MHRSEDEDESTKTSEATVSERAVSRLVTNPIRYDENEEDTKKNNNNNNNNNNNKTTTSSSIATDLHKLQQLNNDRLRNNITNAINIADVMSDIGYAATESNNAFRDILSMCRPAKPVSLISKEKMWLVYFPFTSLFFFVQLINILFNHFFWFSYFFFFEKHPENIFFINVLQ